MRTPGVRNLRILRRMRETSARLLRLLSLLQTRRDWSGVELAERLDITPRTVRRDVDKLRGLGYPVDATVGVGGGYRLGAGAEMRAAAARRRRGARRRARAAVRRDGLGRGHRRVVGTRTHQVAAGDAVTAATPTRGTAGGRRAARTRAERGGRRGAVRDRIGVPRATSVSRSTTGRTTAARAAERWRRIALSAPDLDGIWWRGTCRGRTGGRSASHRMDPRIPPGPRFTPRALRPAGPRSSSRAASAER